MLRRNLEHHTIYQPKKQYTIGEELIFPALQLAPGRVVEQRPGHNPEKAPFDVIMVEMADGKRSEYAANYKWPHRLNDDNVLATLSEEGEQATPEQLYESYGARVAEVIDATLVKHSDFLRIANEWFLRALMAEVNIGHLNLAEAVLDMTGGGPLTTGVILQELGLPPEIAGSVQEISLNNALARDDRFDNVSLDDGTSAWFLRRLEPPEVRTIPASLHPTRFQGDKNISAELRALAEELDDELARGPDAPIEPQPSVELVLTFPHRRAGTLGWSSRVAAVLPSTNKPRLPINFQDRVTGKQLVVWLVRDGLYIYGLGEWYRQNDLPAGAYLELSRSAEGNVVLIDYKRRRPKREWVRVAASREGHLRLETAQRAVACEFDELMSVFVDSPTALDNLRSDHPRDVMQAVREAFPEIAKLSPQGNVHARTLYAVVNVITRATPLDVFAALHTNGAYVPVGDNYWHLSESR
ncbi:MAG: hypothetical protein M1546_17005 [Chloroflexi bacterium]|nr:hypothetical protein [Chloroflexota bacterium]